MARKLTQREVRMLRIGAIAVIAIPALAYGAKWLDHWQSIRASLAEAENRLRDVQPDVAKQASLLSIVPVFEVPQPEEKQKFLFRDKLHEQLKRAGVKTEPLQVLNSRMIKDLDYKVLKIECEGKCKFDQLLDLLAALQENPYLVGIEELNISCDTKQPPEKRQDVDMKLTVSTFVK